MILILPKRSETVYGGTGKGVVYKLSEETADIVVVEDPKLWSREYKPEDFEKDPDKLKLPDRSCFEVIDYIISVLGKEKFIIGHSGRHLKCPCTPQWKEL